MRSSLRRWVSRRYSRSRRSSRYCTRYRIEDEADSSRLQSGRVHVWLRRPMALALCGEREPSGLRSDSRRIEGTASGQSIHLGQRDLGRWCVQTIRIEWGFSIVGCAERRYGASPSVQSPVSTSSGFLRARGIITNSLLTALPRLNGTAAYPLTCTNAPPIRWRTGDVSSSQGPRLRLDTRRQKVPAQHR